MLKFKKEKVKGKGKDSNLWHVGPSDFFDDCPICQATKAALEEGRELSRQELNKAFEEARSRGAVVGNSISDLEKEIGINWRTRLMLKIAPHFLFRRLAKKQGIRRVVFEKAQEVFGGTKRIDLIPLTGGHRGFILILDQETALYFYQDGDHFKYDGYEMGEYERGKVTIFDHLRD